MNTEAVKLCVNTVLRVVNDPDVVKIHVLKQSNGQRRVHISAMAQLVRQEKESLKNQLEVLGYQNVIVRDSDKKISWFKNKNCTSISFDFK